MRLLVVEDSAVLRESLVQGLREAGFAVDAAAEGHAGLQRAQSTEYDLIVLDWMLPGIDGLSLLELLRARGVHAAVLMLTARDATQDKVRGLSAGADDYLVKPFAFEELLARIHALVRRRHGQRSPTLRIGALLIDTQARIALVEPQNPAPAGTDAGTPAARAADSHRPSRIDLQLTPREFALLEYLAMRAGEPVSRMELEAHLYDGRSQVFSNAIDSAVAALRAKLEAAGCAPMIQTRRKIGYLLQAVPP